MTLFASATGQSPKAYDLANLGGAVLAGRIGGAASAAVRGNIRTALQDGAYRYVIHPYETTSGLTDADLTFGFDVGDIRRYGCTVAAADNTVNFNKATNVFVAAGVPGVVRGPPGSFKFTQAVSLNISYVALICDQTEFDFSGYTAANGYAFTVTGSVNPPYDQARARIQGLKLLGNGTAGTVTGLHFNYGGAAGPGPSHLSCNNVTVAAFDVGVLFDGGAYILAMHSLDVYGCNTNISTAANPTNGGASITLHGGSSFNATNYGLVHQNPAGDMFLYGVAFGGCGTAAAGALIEVTAGEVFCSAHLESQNGERCVYVPAAAGTCFFNFDGQMTQDVASASPVIDVQGPCFINLRGGLIAQNNASTSAAVVMATGRYVNLGCHFILAAGQSQETFTAGVNYYTLSPDSKRWLSNMEPTYASITLSAGIVDARNNTATLAAINTPVVIDTSQRSGLYVLSDLTSGGAACFLFVPGFAPNAISNGIANLVASNSAGDFEIEITGGTAPRTISWAKIGV